MKMVLATLIMALSFTGCYAEHYHSDGIGYHPSGYYYGYHYGYHYGYSPRFIVHHYYHHGF